MVYGATFLITFFVSILPIINKFKEFRRFISGVASHDGLYGSGSEQVINWKSFIHNLLDLLWYNPAYTVILALSAALLIYFLINRKKFRTDRLFIWFLAAFILASVIGFILVAKHFKVYYFAPVLSLSGLAFFMIWRLAENRFKPQIVKPLTISLLGVFILVSVLPLPAQYRNRIQQKISSERTAQFYSNQVGKKDILFIEPTWMAGPMVENALTYGISYVAHRNEFYRHYQQLYPNVVTWEGEGKNPGLFRTVEADPESILYSGSDIYVYSSPGRNARQLLNYLDTLASRHAARIRTDTVFTNTDTDEKVIRVRNMDGWKTLSAMKEITEATDFSPASPVSAAFSIRGVAAGDYIEITLLIRNNDKDARCRIIARSAHSEKDGVYFEDSNSLQNIGKGWELLRLRGTVQATPADGILTCQVYYPGKNTITAQDLNIRHMGRR